MEEQFLSEKKKNFQNGNNHNNKFKQMLGLGKVLKKVGGGVGNFRSNDATLDPSGTSFKPRNSLGGGEDGRRR